MCEMQMLIYKWFYIITHFTNVGFAAFCFILSFILTLAAALYISPFVTGSNNEVKLLRAPQEIDTSTCS